MSTASVLDVLRDDTPPRPSPPTSRTTTERHHLARAGTPWSDQLNAIGARVLEARGEHAWRDLRGAWRDLRTIFGPTGALRLLGLPQLAAMSTEVDVEVETK